MNNEFIVFFQNIDTERPEILNKRVATDGSYEFLVRSTANSTGNDEWITEERIDESHLEKYHDSSNAVSLFLLNTMASYYITKRN